jgi:peptide-methionine (S)-S-oxide reductase
MKPATTIWLALGLAITAWADSPRLRMNTSASTEKSTNRTELATFGGGCFWCVEAVFERLDGVQSVTSGYAGGHTQKATYKEVCTGQTGHAEVTQIEFDPKKISFEQLLEVFWVAHDPTTRNRQGADVGTQYRSVIFYQNEAQRVAAEKSKVTAQKDFAQPIVTDIQPLTAFYKAEDYHQDYFRNNGNQPYCQAVIRPKLEKLQKKLGKH